MPNTIDVSFYLKRRPVPVFSDFDREWDRASDATGSLFEWLNRPASPEASRAR